MAPLYCLATSVPVRRHSYKAVTEQGSDGDRHASPRADGSETPLRKHLTGDVARRVEIKKKPRGRYQLGCLRCGGLPPPVCRRKSMPLNSLRRDAPSSGAVNFYRGNASAGTKHIPAGRLLAWLASPHVSPLAPSALSRRIETSPNSPLRLPSSAVRRAEFALVSILPWSSPWLHAPPRPMPLLCPCSAPALPLL
jgi:hypothetical protein